jgi:hypothetical protein
MPAKLKRILLLYSDKYYLVKQVYPFGLDLIANHLRQHGYNVSIEFPFLPDWDPESNLAEILERTNPDLIGLGFRNLDTTMSCEPYGEHKGTGYQTFFFFPELIRFVEILRNLMPDVPIVTGGGAFTISPVAILQTLGIEYGIVGQGEEPLRQFIEAYPDKSKIAKIPSVVFKSDNGFHINPVRSYSLCDLGNFRAREKKFNYAYESVGLPVQVKRGCNQKCSYCVEPLIEGRKYIFKDQSEIIEELKTVAEKHGGIRSIFFVDTEFNLPNLDYCSALVKQIIESGLHEHFRFCSQFLPKPFDHAFAELLADAGFSIILTCDSFADSVLEQNGASYRQQDIIRTLELCEKCGIDCTLALIFGLPGETYDTVDHSIRQMLSYPPNVLRRYEYTVGGRIYNGTPLCQLVERQGAAHHVYGKKSAGYIEPYYYCSPVRPLELKAYIEDVFPFPPLYQNQFDQTKHQTLAISYLIDQEKWGKGTARFFESDLAAQTSIYDYMFRKLADSGKIETAKTVSEHLLGKMLESRKSAQYKDEIAVVQYYLSLLETAS